MYMHMHMQTHMYMYMYMHMYVYAYAYVYVNVYVFAYAYVYVYVYAYGYVYVYAYVYVYVNVYVYMYHDHPVTAFNILHMSEALFVSSSEVISGPGQTLLQLEGCWVGLQECLQPELNCFSSCHMTVCLGPTLPNPVSRGCKNHSGVHSTS